MQVHCTFFFFFENICEKAKRNSSCCNEVSAIHYVGMSCLSCYFLDLNLTSHFFPLLYLKIILLKPFPQQCGVGSVAFLFEVDF